MKNKILISSILITTLFLGCGGTSSSSYDTSSLTSSISGNIAVVNGMKKSIIISSKRKNARFKFVDRDAVPNGTELNLYTGVLVYRALIGVGTVLDISVIAYDDKGWESKPLVVTFETVSAMSVKKIKVFKTGANDGGKGENLTFSKNNDKNIVDSLGRIWEDGVAAKLNVAKSYQSADLKCEILRLSHKGTNWRVPTKDEILDLVDYSKNTGSNMLNNAFEDINATTWVKSENGNYFVFSQQDGLIREGKFSDKHPVRCINAPKVEYKHVISTDRKTDITKDFNTALQWTPMTEDSFRKIDDDTNQTASEYCETYGEGGWRLPSFSEVRSIIEDNTVSPYIVDRNKIIISSTHYNNIDKNAKNANYIIRLDDKKVIFGASYTDSIYPITCVK